MTNLTKKETRVDASALRWQCDPLTLGVESTAELGESATIVGQKRAMDALEFGLECLSRGQNIYVRGFNGTGRMTMVRRAIDDVQREEVKLQDRCYVHNFKKPDRPRLITLPAGVGREFQSRVKSLAVYISEDLPGAFVSDAVKSEEEGIRSGVEKNIKELTEPLEAELKTVGLALVALQSGQASQPAIFPLIDKQPVTPLEFFQLAKQGKVTPERKEKVEELLPKYQKQLRELTRQISEVWVAGTEQVKKLHERICCEFLENYLEPIKGYFEQPAIDDFLQEVLQDVIETRLASHNELPDAKIRYGVNLLLGHNGDSRFPVIEDNMPTYINLLGTVESEWVANGRVTMDYRGIKAGTLLRADGGYLILDVKDVLTEPGAWHSLMRTLRTGLLEIVPAELGANFPVQILKPEPIAVNVRVILVGDSLAYYQLNQLDPDFAELFKVLADVDSEIERSDDSVRHYGSILAGLAERESLLHFDKSAVARLVEHGARIAASENKLSARFGRIADLAREASYLAKKQGNSLVSASHIIETIQRTKDRANMPSVKFQDLVKAGTIRIQTRDKVIGQINGLALMLAGPLTYGFPARITATIGAGRAGLINIEGRADMSGSIHTKGFYILGGLLRHLLKTNHPLAFSASIAFEQSYGGIDGDSASGAETCCLLSALTDIAIDQSIAMTGAIDQHGRIQAIGGVNEKIEGFFDTCAYFGLSGAQGVIIPLANVGDLMLRPDVVSACEAGQFAVYAVENIQQALEILSGTAAGRLESGAYPEGSLLAIALDKADAYWRKSGGGKS